jgi:hypothetical protein
MRKKRYVILGSASAAGSVPAIGMLHLAIRLRIRLAARSRLAGHSGCRSGERVITLPLCKYERAPRGVGKR